MIACFDVHYDNGFANAAAIVFNQWADDNVVDKYVVRCNNVREYNAGSFYKRELEPLLKVIRQIDYPIQTFVIDAYCHLSDDCAPGLGAYLYQELPDNSNVIGVAKNRFRKSSHAIELLRGGSERPLFISSIGIEYQAAADHVQSMSGDHRIPTLLKMVDRLSRTGGITAWCTECWLARAFGMGRLSCGLGGHGCCSAQNQNQDRGASLFE